MISFLDFDVEKIKPKRKITFTRLFAIFSAVGIISVGTTLATIVTLNTNGQTEFGQGVLVATACDGNGMNVSPVNSFRNSAGTGKFEFDGILIDNISGNCAGKDLVIRVYDEDGNPLELTRETPPVTQIRLYFNPMPTDGSLLIDLSDLPFPNTVNFEGYWPEQFTLEGPATTLINVSAVGNLSAKSAEVPEDDQPALRYFQIDAIENSVQIDFDPTDELVSNFRDTRNVYKITIESKEHVA